MTDKQKQRPANNVYKNRRNSSKFKAFGSYYTLCLTENLALRKSPTFHTNRYVPFLNDNANRYRQTNEFT